jgi:ferredoxin-NADP reductase
LITLIDAAGLAAIVSAAKSPTQAHGVLPLGAAASLHFLAPARGRLNARCHLSAQEMAELSALYAGETPYSLSAPPLENMLRITVKVAGDHSRSLLELQPGTRVFAEGPFGAFTSARRRKRKVLLIAGGVGITPIRALFESLPGGPGDLTLVYRASQAGDVVFRNELESIAGQRGARMLYVFGRRGNGRRPDPLNAGELRRVVPQLGEHDVYLCGPPGMTEHARTELRRAGVSRRQIHHESFTL